MHTLETTYFAYGSNMDLPRIQKRCPSAKKIANGWLDDYRLAFNMRGVLDGTAGGGVANIVYEQSARVYGVLYTMEPKDLNFLNDLEVSANYEVVAKPIIIDSATELHATLYIGDREETRSWEPTEVYRNYILNGIRNNSLPTSYLEDAKEIMGVLDL